MTLLCKTAVRLVPRQLFAQQKRFRGKIRIRNPGPPHHERAKVLQLIKPVYKDPLEGIRTWEMCQQAQKANIVKERTYNPYERIIAREVLNWFNNSKMVAIFHANSFTDEDAFEAAVRLKKVNMHIKYYGPAILKLALEGTPYDAVRCLFRVSYRIVFSPEVDVTGLMKALKKTPQLVLLAGVIQGRFLNHKDFLEYGSFDITTRRALLVQVLQNAAGNNLNRQITHHQTTLVSRLKQIGKTETPENKDGEALDT